MTNSNFNLPRPNYVSLDLFPAEIYVNGEKLGHELKIIVTDADVYVFSDGPTLIYSDEHTKFDGSTKLGYTVETDADTLEVKRASGCGCGSRLRGFHPFLGVPHVSHTTRRR